MFETSGQKGFHMSFANGWTVSVQWGAANYCNDSNLTPSFSNGNRKISGPTAEIAAWNAENIWHIFEDSGDSVAGWQTPEEVAAFISFISNRER